MADDSHHDRRTFLVTAATTLTATCLGLMGSVRTSADTKSSTMASGSTSGGRTSFESLKQVDAGLLNVGYAEAGPADGPAVLLLHEWPYDIHSYVDVAPLLAARGYRAIVPYLRGYGTTRFRSSRTFPPLNPALEASAEGGEFLGCPDSPMGSRVR